MKKSLTKAIAITAVCAAGLSGALMTNTSAVAGSAKAHSSSKAVAKAPTGLVKTPFGYKADVFGTKLLVDGVEVKTLKDGYAQQRCTAMAGRPTSKNSILAIPEDLTDLIKLSLTTNKSLTYKQGNRYGVKGISTVGDIALGGEVPGLGKVPELTIEGLQSVSDAFHDAKGFGHEESFSFKGITLDYEGTVVDGTPLADLLDILNGVTGTATPIVNQVIDLLTSITGDIEIPGLGAIGLGTTSGSVTKHSATSESYALKILINATGNDTVLQLGRARTRIANPVKAGVFRGTATGLDLLSGTSLHLGNLGQRSIPCEGTSGKVKKQKTAHISVLGGLVDLTGITYKYMGLQKPNGYAEGMIGTTLGSVSIPSLGLVIDGIRSKVDLLKPKGTKRVTKKVTTSVAKITLDGKELQLPAVGEVLDLGDGNFLEYRKISHNNYFGTEVKVLVLSLGDSFMPGGSILDLGTAAGRIFPR